MAVSGCIPRSDKASNCSGRRPAIVSRGASRHISAAGSVAEQIIVHSAIPAFPRGPAGCSGQCLSGMLADMPWWGVAPGAADMPNGMSTTATRTNSFAIKPAINLSLERGSISDNQWQRLNCERGSPVLRGPTPELKTKTQQLQFLQLQGLQRHPESHLHGLQPQFFDEAAASF